MVQPLKSRPRNGDVAAENPDFELLDALPWRPSFHVDDDSLSLIIGSNDSKGGFFTLEEIDESHYQLEAKNVDSTFDDVAENSNAMLSKEEMKFISTTKKKKQKKNKKKKEERNTNLTINNIESVTNNAALNYSDSVEVSRIHSFEAETVDENEFLAWEELRLHPLLMRSIHKLGFKEPSPIQKACIPPAAHQGKDVIGAAETGSGKTLAFGLPILQRLLQEQEKATRQLKEIEMANKKYVSEGLLRALIITPTRELALQVTDHLKAVAAGIDVRVVPIVGGMSTEKQERLLRNKPDIIVGTPGRLWELMSGGETHLTELHSLSFFVLDEADRMIESGHYRELQFIIDMLPVSSCSGNEQSSFAVNGAAVSAFRIKRRQTFVFSATLALSADFRKKLKCKSLKPKQSMNDELNSIETLSERAGMRANVMIVDLTNASIVANKLEESFIECREEDKDAYLYYILSVHGQVRTIIFCTSISSLRHTSSLLKTLGINVSTLHAQMQQRARLKAIDRIRGNEHGILVATDVAARGLDIPGVRTIIHYQLPHSAEVYVHRSGRTARAASDGCSIALISPNDRSKFSSLCKSFSKESFRQFPIDSSFMQDILKRLSLARQIDKVLRSGSQEKASSTWFKRNAELLEYDVDEDNSEEELVNIHKKRKASAAHLKNIQQQLNDLLSRPLKPKTFSHRFFAGAGISPILQQQLEVLGRERMGDKNSGECKRRKLVVIGQACVEPLQALRSAGSGTQVNLKNIALKKRKLESSRRDRIKIKMEEKKRVREQRRKQRKKQKAGNQ